MSGQSYFYRINHKDVKFNRIQEENHQYNFTGIARGEKGLEQYCHYFISPYTKEYHLKEPDSRVEKEHVSIMFRHFLKIYLLKALISKEVKLGMIILETIFDLMGNGSNDYVSILPFVKAFVNHMYQTEFRYYVSNGATSYLAKMQAISHHIDKIHQQFLAHFQENLPQMKKHQFFPEGFLISDQSLMRYVRDSFQRIINLHIPRRSQRRNVLKEFFNTNINYLNLRIPFFTGDMSKKDSINSIILPKFSLQQYPIITKCISYLNASINHQQERPYFTKVQISKEIVTECIRYNMGTNAFYPDLQIDDIYIDMKTLKPVVSYNCLIRDSICLKGKIKSIEMQLTTEPTPKPVTLQACHLERIDRCKWLMLRKYYFPNSEKRQAGNEGGRLGCQIVGKDLEEHEHELTQEQLLQKIHVWRLISIIYEIIHTDSLTKALYNHYYCKIFLKGQQESPQHFQIDKYFEIQRNIFNDMVRGSLKLGNLIKIQQDTQSKMMMQQQNGPLGKNGFNFHLQQLQTYLEIENQQDSMLESLRTQLLQSYLYERYLFLKQISSRLLHKTSFKKMTNIMKYIINQFINIYEELQLRILIRTEASYPRVIGEQKLIAELQKSTYKEVMIMDEFKRRHETIKVAEQKLKEYQTRTDGNAKFAHNNPDIINEVQRITKEYYRIISLEEIFHSKIDIHQRREIINIELNLEIKEESEAQMNQIVKERLMEKVSLLSAQLTHTIHEIIQRLIFPHLDNCQHFNKPLGFRNKLVGIYYNYELVTLLRTYLTMNKKNWLNIKNYSTPVFNYMGNRIFLLRIESLQENELKNMIKKLIMIDRIIEAQRPQDLRKRIPFQLGNYQQPRHYRIGQVDSSELPSSQ